MNVNRFHEVRIQDRVSYYFPTKITHIYRASCCIIQTIEIFSMDLFISNDECCSKLALVEDASKFFTKTLEMCKHMISHYDKALAKISGFQVF